MRREHIESDFVYILTVRSTGVRGSVQDTNDMRMSRDNLVRYVFSVHTNIGCLMICSGQPSQGIMIKYRKVFYRKRFRMDFTILR